MTRFHNTYYQLLEKFAAGHITRLMVSVPPQHGKSLGASRLLPAYMLGIDPSLRIAIGSYSSSLARRFGREVGQVIDNKNYQKIFPLTRLKTPGTTSEGATRTTEECDLVGQKGGLRLVGRECALTGNRVDVMIMDDIYKDAMEANSPIVRQNAWQWYTSVVRTRMHNNSREIIIFTRWHEDDLIGQLSRTEPVVELHDMRQLDDLPPYTWVKINFPALQNAPSTNIDTRKMGEPLWPQRHSARLLLEKQALDTQVFESLYQGNPTPVRGLLYGTFECYDALPEHVTTYANYTDTADTGSDSLCSVCYVVGTDTLIYITHVLHTPLAMESTEQLVAQMLADSNTREALIESNNGGRGFARAVAGHLKGVPCVIKTFHQSASKVSRILSNASTLTANIRMPRDWKQRWPTFAAEMLGFRRDITANAHDDAPDTLTGIVETELADPHSSKKIQFVAFSEH